MLLSLLALVAGLPLAHAGGPNPVVGSPELTAVVGKTEIKSPDGLDLICLGEGWERINDGVALRIEAFREKHADTFYSSSNCFAPAKLGPEGREDLSVLLSRLEEVSGGRFAGLTSLPDVVQAPRSGFWKRWGIAEGYIGGVQLGIMGVSLFLPASVTNWEGGASLKPEKFVQAFSHPPVWDRDEWYLNYVAHPFMGATYYNAVRSQGGGMLESFLFSTLQSFKWEFLIESWKEQPSAQDLLITSTIGSVLGELEHRATLKMRQNGFNTIEKVIVTVINPMYVIMNGYE